MKRLLQALVVMPVAVCATYSEGFAQFPGGGPGMGPNGIGSPGLAGYGPQDNVSFFLTGKVVMADGSPLPGSVNIERICGSSEHVAAYTDSSGHFNFQWGEAQGGLPDVSETFVPVTTGQTGRAAAMNEPVEGCELRAVLPGYRSDVINLDEHGTLDSPNIGIIVLHRLANVEGLSVSATSLAAPPQAKKFYIKGLQSAHKGNFPDAAKNLEKAVGIYPQYANAWLDLAKVRMNLKLLDAAREAYQKALSADNKLVEAQVGLGIIAAGAAQWQEAAKYLDAALHSDPVDFPRVWYIDAVANYNIGNLEAAQESVRRAMKADPQHNNPEEDRLFGIILAARRETAPSPVQTPPPPDSVARK